MFQQRSTYFNESSVLHQSEEPLYATVARQRRNKITFVHQLESKYGGSEIANNAAVVIQRAFRNFRLQKKFSRVLSMATTGTEKLNQKLSYREQNNNKGLKRDFPSPIDLLILQAAGLGTNFGSMSGPSARLIKNRQLGGRHSDSRLQRSASYRASSGTEKCNTPFRARDDSFLQRRIRPREDDETSPLPPPCPPLRGESFYPHSEPIYMTGHDQNEPIYVTKNQIEPVYVTRENLYRSEQRPAAPRPPQRTVSFLVHDTLPRKMSQIQKLQQPVLANPEHCRTLSNPLTSQHISGQHFRTYSSPAPLSPLPPPPPPVEDACDGSYRSDSPLPPPPYIPPPSPTRCPDTPLPPPPHVSSDLSKVRTPSDSGSSASSTDSGFRSSYCDVITDQHQLQSTNNFIGSPESLASLGDCVFEPRPLTVMPEDIYVSASRRLWCDEPQRNANNALMQDIYEQIYQLSPNPSSFSKPASTPPKVKKTVRIQTPDIYGQQNQAYEEQVANEDEELTRRRQYRVGLNLFNQNPERGMTYLWSKKFLDYSPAAVAKFFRGRKGLSKTKIGEYLCSLHRPFNLAALHCFIHEVDFTGLHLDIALRQLQQEVTFPKEAQKIEKFVEVFSKRYIQCNQMFVSGFNSPDTVFVLSYAIVLLNTDLHSQALRPNKRMKREDFVRNLNGIDAGHNVDEDMLKGIYERIRSSEFRAGADHVSQVAKVEEAIVGRKREQGSLAEPFRRLVCFCRLAEVPDMHKKVKRDGAHQRGVFLFNDLLIVCKTISNKRKTVHQFRYSVSIRNLRINVFSTAQFNYGVQLQDHAGKIVATFNAKSESDQQRFVTDLQEAVAEMNEMERVDFEAYDSEYETMC